MTSETIFVKNESGSILVELNLLFLMLALVGGICSQSVQTFFLSYKTLLAELEIARDVRYTESILRRELSYNTAQVRLGQDINGKEQIICRKTNKNVNCYWYISNGILYRKTVKDASTGINPFSNTEIQIQDFQTARLGTDRIGILMTVRHLETGLTRKIPITVSLSNGYVAD